MAEPRRFVVSPAENAARLDNLLEEWVSDHSRARLQKLVRKGHVRVDGRRVFRSNLRLPQGARVELSELPEGRQEVGTVFEDEHIAVLEKPAGLLVHPTDRLQTETLTEELVRRYGDLPHADDPLRPGIVHRLDRETSGLVVIARTRPALLALKRAFREREVKKTYYCLCHGTPHPSSFEVDLPIGPSSGQLDHQRVNPPVGGKESFTAFRVREDLGGFAWLECFPRTGRRHQIRVHVTHAGHPILGDRMYAGERERNLPPGFPPVTRQALHAAGLGFRHPESGEELHFESGLPADLQRAVDWLREHAARDAPESSS